MVAPITGSACEFDSSTAIPLLTLLCQISGDSYTQTGFVTNGTLPVPGNPLGNPQYPVSSSSVSDSLFTPTTVYRATRLSMARTGSMWTQLCTINPWF